MAYISKYSKKNSIDTSAIYARYKADGKRSEEDAKMLIPYAGAYISSVIKHGDASRNMNIDNYGHNDSVYLISPKKLQGINTTDWIRGMRSDGQEYFTTPYGLVFCVKNLPEGDDVVYSDGYTIPTPEWTMQSLLKMEFLKYVPAYTTTYQEYTAEGRKKKELEKSEHAKLVELRIAAVNKAIGVILKDHGVEVNDESIDLYKYVIYFDCTYEYSDDHKYCIAYRAREQEKRTIMKAKYPALEALLDARIKAAFTNK